MQTVENCHACSVSSTQCSQCNCGYVLDTTSGICTTTSVSPDTNCSTCSASDGTTCLECNSGFTLVATDMGPSCCADGSVFDFPIEVRNQHNPLSITGICMFPMLLTTDANPVG